MTAPATGIPQTGPRRHAPWLLLAAAPLLVRALPRIAGEWVRLPETGHLVLALPAGLYFVLRGLLPPKEDRPLAVTQSFGWTVVAVCLLTMATLFFYLDVKLQETFFLALGCWCAGMGAVGFCRGRTGFVRTGFGWLLLLFALPWPPVLLKTVLHIRLQRISTLCASVPLRWAGLETEVTGTLLRVGGNTLNVAEQCSGLKFVLIHIVAALILGRLRLASQWGRRCLLVLIASLLAMAANVLRLVLAGGIANAWDLSAAISFLHGWSVLPVYVVGVGALCGFAALLDTPPVPEAPDA